MAYTEEFLTPDDVADEHSSEKVFPELDDDCFPHRMEWGEGPCYIQMVCGCMVEVYTGDILWMVFNEDRTQMHPVAIDPVTIH